MTEEAAPTHRPATWMTVGRAILQGLFLAIVGEMALLLIYLVNLLIFPVLPWSVVPASLFVVLLWRGLGGVGLPEPAAGERRWLRRGRWPGWRGWAWSLAAALAALAALQLAAWGSAPQPGFPDAATPATPAFGGAALLPQLPLADLGDHGLTLWAIFITNYILFAPLIEEAAFRGLMQRPLEIKLGPLVALPVVALLFALLHGDRGAPLLYLAVALLLGLLAWRSGSIWPGVVAHGAVNLWALFPSLLGSEALPARLAGSLGAATAPTAAALAAVAAFCLYRLGKVERPEGDPVPADLR